KSGGGQLDPYGESAPDSERHPDESGGRHAHDGNIRAGTAGTRQNHETNRSAFPGRRGVRWAALNMKEETANACAPVSLLPATAGKRLKNCAMTAYGSLKFVKLQKPHCKKTSLSGTQLNV